MGLTGINPSAGTPSDLRELVLGAGSGSGASSDLPVIIFGNKTSAGSATVDVPTDPVVDSDDVIAKAGRRSELYREWAAYTSVDKDAKIYLIPITESVGTAASRTITFAGGNASAAGTWLVELVGESIQVAVFQNDDVTAQALAVSNAINAASGGTWPVTASPAAGVVTVTTANKGPRNILILNRLRVTALPVAFTSTATISANSGGATEDDASAAILAATNSEYAHWVLPFHTTSAPTTTDNQIGEAILAIITQMLPINGKEQFAHIGLVGTQAQATTVATSSACNTTRAFFYHAENNDWTPGMLAAHHAAIYRSSCIVHPSANIAGWTQTDNTIYLVPKPYDINDRPTAVEIEADINNGVSPVAFRPNGAAYLARHVTSRSLNAQGLNDYHAREGHIPSAIDFAWREFKGRLQATKRLNPFVSDNLKEGATPIARTLTPIAVEGIMRAVIEDLTSSKPLGKYDGPILAPDSKDAQKNSANATKVPAGISIEADLRAVEHLLFTRTKIREVGAAY